MSNLTNRQMGDRDSGGYAGWGEYEREEKKQTEKSQDPL